MDNLTLSIIFPTRNAEWCLSYSLESIKNQTVQPEEILICVGKSEDRTEEIVLEFQKNSRVPVKVFYDNDGLGTGYAMNLLVSNTKTDILLWGSSDVIKPKDWIYNILKFYTDNPDLVYLTSNEKELNSKDIKEYLTKKDEEYTGNFLYNNGGIVTIYGLSSFRRKNVLGVGNFDPFFNRGQDLDMTIRLALSGARGGGETEPMGVHFGVHGTKNLNKVFKHGTYFKFLYKYGLKYISLIPHHTFAVLIRSVFLFSLISLLISYILSIQTILSLSIFTFILSLISILFGLYITHHRITLNLLLLQFFDSIGEYYQLYLLIKEKNKKEMGYGNR